MQLQRPDLFHEAAFINGEWIAENGDITTVYDPATERTLGIVPNLTAPQVKGAISNAEAAFTNWKKTSAKKRAALLKGWHENVLAHADDLALIISLEEGKPLAEAKQEVFYAAGFIEWFAAETVRIYGQTFPMVQPDQRSLTIRQPVGVVAAITPWNFPAAMVTRKVAPALAAGCTIVLKPSEETPFSALALAHLAQEAGIPNGVLNVVTGDPKQIGKILTQSSAIRKVSFTGSTAVGKLLLAESASTVKRVSLELGGNAPFIIFDDANIDTALDCLMQAKFRNSGQTCICANRIFIQENIYQQLIPAITERMSQLKVGPGQSEGIDQGPLNSGTSVKKIKTLVEQAQQQGANITQSHTVKETGHYYAPTLLTELDDHMAIAQEEIFGPVIAVYPFKTEDELIERANNTAYGLAAYLFTQDIKRIWHLSESLEYGMVGVNQTGVSSEMTPFGGVKESGIGREGSSLGIDEYLEHKYIAMGDL